MTSIHKLYSTYFDIIFISPILLDNNEEFFSGGGELHLKGICDIFKSSKKILVIQMTSKDSYIIERDNILILLVKSYNILHFKLNLRFLLLRVHTRIIHFNYIGLETYVKRKKDVIYSATFHGTGWDFPTRDFPKPYVDNSLKMILGAKFKKFLMIREQNSAIKKLDKILSVDTSILRYCQQFMPSYSNKIVTVFNYVDMKKFSPVKITKSKHGQNFFKILYPRNISFARGVHYLIPLAMELKRNNINAVIYVVGKGIEQIGGTMYEEKLNTEIINNKLEHMFHFVGRESHKNMPRLYNNCDLVIIPSNFSEGTSFSCLEAMSCRKIVVATRVGGLNDLILDRYNGFLSDTSVLDFSQTVINVYKDIDNLSHITSNAYEIISSSNTVKVWQDKVLSYFSNLDNI